MADYYTNFSIIVPLPNEQAQKYALTLAEQASNAQQAEETPKEIPALLAEVIEDWNFETEIQSSHGKWGIWLHSSSGGVDAVCAFIQHLLKKFTPAECVEFEWSHDCSKPRVDAYGGGAAFITARNIKTITTSNWLHRQAARALKRRQKGTNA